MAFYGKQGGTERVSLQDFDPTSFQKLGASIQEAWANSLGPTIVDAARENFTTQPKLSAEEANNLIKQSGYDIGVTAKDNEYSASQIDLLVERKRQEKVYTDVRQRTPWDWGSPVRGLAMFGAGVLDPVNLATAFVPWSKAITIGQTLRAASLSSSLAVRTGGRVGFGALDGGISAAAIEPFYAGMRLSLHDDYSATESLANIAFGTALGGGVLSIGGLGVDAFKRATGRALPSDRFVGLSPDQIQQVQALDVQIKSGDLSPEALQTTLQSYTPEMRRAAGFPDINQITPDAPEITPATTPNRPPSRLATVTEADGQVTVRRKNVELVATQTETSMRIDSLSEKRRTAELGPDLVERLVNEAAERGLDVETPNTVSAAQARAIDNLVDRGLDVQRAENTVDVPSSPEMPDGGIATTDGSPVYRIRRGEGYEPPVDNAQVITERVSPETREAAFRGGLAQMMDGRALNVEPIIKTDPQAGGNVTAADLQKAAEINQQPESIRTADFEASQAIEAENQASQGWNTKVDAETAMQEADTQLEQTIKAGADAYKYSRSQGPSPQDIGPIGFYSALSRNIGGLDTKAATPAGWKQAITGMVKKGAVKEAEIEWTGLNDWLDLQEGRVTKEQVNEFLQNNGVRVEEVTLGEVPQDQSAAQTANDIEEILEAGQVFDDDASSFLQAYKRARSEGRRDTQAEAGLEEYLRDAGDNRNIQEIEQASAEVVASAAKYGEYTLAGGKNYREILLRLPKKARGATDTEIRIINDRLESQGFDELGQEQIDVLRVGGNESVQMLIDFDDRIGVRTDDLIETMQGAMASDVFRSSHFDEPNILAHMRVNDRVDADGNKVLFVEELQSDWAQEGRKRGFELTPQEIEQNQQRINQIYEQITALRESGVETPVADTPIEQVDPKFLELQKLMEQRAELQTSQLDSSRIPSAPFVQDTKGWLSLSLKRLMYYAAENDYDKVAFINGKQSAERYDLSQQIGKINARPTTDGKVSLEALTPDMSSQVYNKVVSVDELDEIIGKELADRIRADIKFPTGFSDPGKSVEMSGLDLQVGGEGIKGFYDKIVPNNVKDLLKKFGGDQVEQVTFEAQAMMSSDELISSSLMGEQAQDFNQLGFTVTPKMRERLSAGVPMFARGGFLGTTENLDLMLAESFGKDSARLLEAGQIRTVNRPSDMPGGPHPDDVKGMTAPDGTVYIVAQNVSPAEVQGIVLHEVGVHVGMEKMLGTEAFNDVLTQLDKAVMRGESWAQDARDAVPDDTPSDLIREEQLAYLVQNAPELPLVKRIIAAVRAWAVRNFPEARARLQLTEADYRALASSALRFAARQTEQQTAVSPVYARGKVEDTSTAEQDLELADSNLKRVRSYASVLRAAADKLEDDAATVAAMRSELPDISMQEIDDLLEGLKAEVSQMRQMGRAAKQAMMAGDKAAELQSDAMMAADTMANNLEMAASIERRNAVLNLNARLKATSFINQFKEKGLDFEGFAALLVGSERVRVGSRASIDGEFKGFKGELIGGLIADLEKINLKKEFISGRFDRDIYDALYRKGTGASMEGISPQAAQMAEIVSKYQQVARNRRNRFGAWIRDLQGYITRQSHDMYKIRAATEGEWTNFVKDRLDVPKMVKLGLISETDPMGSLRVLYDDFAAGVHLKETGSDNDLGTMVRGSNLARRESVSRTLYFKDGVSAFEYNERFGVGTLSQAVLNGFDRAAASTALMKNLGTNPEATLRRLMDEYENGLSFDSNRRAKFRQNRQAILNLLSQVDGSVYVPGNVTAAKVGGILRSIQNMARLGGAVISSTPDLVGYAAELRYGQGKNLFSGVAGAIQSLIRGRAKGEQGEILASLGVFHESVVGSIAARFDSPELVAGKMSALQQMFFRLNGLTWWTESLRDGAALSHSHYMAKNSGKVFDEINPELRRMLGLYNIDAGKWEIIKRATVKVSDGKQYISGDAIHTLPRQMFEQYISSVGRTVNDASVQNLRDDLQQALRTMMVDRAHHASVEPNARARAFMLRGTKPGTIPGELLRYMGQFKSFSVSMVQMVLGREVYGRGYDTFGQYLREGKGDMLGLAAMIGMYGAMGYAAMSVKDLLKGREPRDPTDPRTLFAAMAQGGGLGLYGDFLFGEYSRFGRSFTASIAGPVLGNLDTLLELWTRMRNGDDTAAVAFKSLINNTPFLNLFWLRPLLDYAILFNIQESLNPGALRRMEKRIERQNNQSFLFKPSEVVR